MGEGTGTSTKGYTVMERRKEVVCTKGILLKELSMGGTFMEWWDLRTY